MKDFLFREPLEQLDPELAELIEHESERQVRKLVMVPSESISPRAVHRAVASDFAHIYAEGYPGERTRALTEEEILDYESELGHFRRYSDPRYYKGVEYADVVEALARRRTAEVFANDLDPDRVYVNVQALSGAPANTAVQHALMDPGDVLMSLSLYVGGHLTHGSKVAYSGKTYDVVHYGVDERTERIDYDAVRELALEHRPKLIIAGYTSYPLQVDWQAFREIADKAGAYLLADIAHIAGMVAAGVLENPVGIADVVTFTTHKSMTGPRGSVIVTHDAKIRRAVDRAVFPGLQGGPHMETIAGIAAVMKIAQTEKFRRLQEQIVANAKALSKALKEEGVRVAYDGTDTHMVLIDTKPIQGPDGTPLMGDPAANILDLVGIVANRNTIPGDTTAAYPSGVRFGTPWITQRGLKEREMERIAKAVARVLQASIPFTAPWRRRTDYRARVPFDVLEEVKQEVAKLAAEAGSSTPLERRSGYPHFYSLADQLVGEEAYERLELVGYFAKPFVDWLTPSHTADMVHGDSRPVTLLEADGSIMAAGLLTRVDDERYHLDVPTEAAARVATWLRALVDGYVTTDDVWGRLHFLDAVRDLGAAPEPEVEVTVDEPPYTKPYYIGAWSHHEPAGEPLPRFEWQEDEGAPLRETRLHETHVELGARMVPFGGWDMPVWYTGNLDEHRAVREAAGLFDVSHMGVWDLSGLEAASFLNMIMTNDVEMLEVGQSQYSAMLDVDGVPLDDLLIYRLSEDHYLVVVNAANNDKDWIWVNAVLNGEVMIDPQRPWVRFRGEELRLRDLRDPSSGADMRHELALQGPKAREVLLELGGSEEDLEKVRSLPWAGITRAELGGFDLLVSRTGYTGERIAYELFVHPDRIVDLWKKLLEVGEPYGVQPAGLAARDSLRIEAGLPLYGHELAGPLNLTMSDAGFGSYVKLYNPFFVGREAYVEREAERKAHVVRFRVPEKGQPRPEVGDPVVSDRGKVVGTVTSSAIDTEGYLMGQAYLDDRYADEGTELSVLVTPRRQPKPQGELGMGDRVQLPVPIEVLRRFPKR